MIAVHGCGCNHLVLLPMLNCRLFCKNRVMVHLQVLNMRQAAEVLVRAGPNKFVVPALLRYLADQRGFPTAQQIVDGADETAIADDWSLFCQYTGAVNPYVSMHEGYIPIHSHQQSAASVQPFLY